MAADINGNQKKPKDIQYEYARGIFTDPDFSPA